MITIRLSFELERKLNQIAKEENKTKTDIVKKALQNYFSEYFNKRSASELGKDLFGKYGSGKRNLSRDYKKILKEKISEKHTY